MSTRAKISALLRRVQGAFLNLLRVRVACATGSASSVSIEASLVVPNPTRLGEHDPLAGVTASSTASVHIKAQCHQQIPVAYVGGVAGTPARPTTLVKIRQTAKTTSALLLRIVQDQRHW